MGGAIRLRFTHGLNTLRGRVLRSRETNGGKGFGTGVDSSEAEFDGLLESFHGMDEFWYFSPIHYALVSFVSLLRPSMSRHALAMADVGELTGKYPKYQRTRERTRNRRSMGPGSSSWSVPATSHYPGHKLSTSRSAPCHSLGQKHSWGRSRTNTCQELSRQCWFQRSSTGLQVTTFS